MCCQFESRMARQFACAAMVCEQRQDIDRCQPREYYGANMEEETSRRSEGYGAAPRVDCEQDGRSQGYNESGRREVASLPLFGGRLCRVWSGALAGEQCRVFTR